MVKSRKWKDLPIEERVERLRAEAGSDRFITIGFFGLMLAFILWTYEIVKDSIPPYMMGSPGEPSPQVLTLAAFGVGLFMLGYVFKILALRGRYGR